MPFRDAHAVIGKLVFYAISRDKALDDLTLEEFKSFSDVFDEDIYDVISMETCVSQRKVYGAPAKEAVLKSIEAAEKEIERLEEGQNL